MNRAGLDQALGPDETPDGLHRRWLCREVAEHNPLFDPQPSRTLMFCMLNPSKASATRNDPTSVRIVNFTRLGGYHVSLVGNIYTLRATDPRDVDAADPASNVPDADQILMAMAAMSDAIVLAWGAASRIRNRPAMLERAHDVRLMLQGAGKSMYQLGTSKDGQPRHPLMLAKVVEWERIN